MEKKSFHFSKINLIIFLLFACYAHFNIAYAQAPTCLQLGPVNDSDDITWNAIIKGNLFSTGADTEGRLAVGGNWTIETGYSIGAGNSTNQLPQSNGTRDDLIVGKDFTNNGGNWQVFNGNAVYGGQLIGSNPSFGGTGNQLIHDPNADPDRFDFAEAFRVFENISQTLASFSQNGNVADDGYGGITLTGAHPALNIFEINSDMIANWGGITLTIDVPNTSVVIINIDSASFELNGGSFQTNIRERVILNFHKATYLKFQSFAVLGTVLAPYADMDTSGGNIDGHVIIGGNALQSGGFEPHYYPFTGCFDFTAAVGDFVWLDENGNGIQDEGEPGVPNVTVHLLDQDDTILKTTITDSDGYYLFNDIQPLDHNWDPISYRIKFIKPDGYEFTIQNAGSDPELDSDANINTGLTAPFTLSPGETKLDIDAGLLEEPIEEASASLLLLTEGPCWRFFSSPFQLKRNFQGDPATPVPDSATPFTYNDMIGQWWTQGVTGSNHPASSSPNVLWWPLDQSGNSDTGWTAAGFDLNSQTTAGRGFMMSVFTDDDFGVPGTWDKEVSFTYIEDDVWGYDSDNPDVSLNVPAPLNTTNGGWSLIGNPYDESVQFSLLSRDRVKGVAYVYDRNWGGTGAGDDIGDNIGGWRSVNDANYGDIPSGYIVPFQGFFVQNDDDLEGNTPALSFTNASKVGDLGEFYGKEQDRNFVRLDLRGEGLYNSTWVTFSENGTFNRINSDAYELYPFTEQYALFGSRKGDELFDIGQFPFAENTEVPIAVETTLGGRYTISATDLSVPAGSRLYFVDRQENVSIPIDEHFSYTFTTNAVQQKRFGMEALSCGATQEQIAQFFRPEKAKMTGTDRFAVVVNPKEEFSGAEMPQSVDLRQNYPNPFNPTTVISYQLPQTSDVTLNVYDLTGRQVATLVNGTVQAGVHNVNFNAADLASGVYVYRLTAGNTVLTRKLTLVK